MIHGRDTARAAVDQEYVGRGVCLAHRHEQAGREAEKPTWNESANLPR